ncbi:MAG: hypothetical protein KatS3mg014_0764 [Actinomycetota bacterium]|nr:MAG: hypothetical protein KatS3mg014_0764 [Actinomycetota bacterium]
MATTITNHGFRLHLSDRALGRNLPQRVGGVLWLPTLLMAVMAFPAGAILGGVRAAAIADAREADTVAALGQLVPAVNFLGFASVFAAVSFAIARILGEFREGGGRVQEVVSGRVQTPVMPATARGFIVLMATGMMALLGAVVGHVVLGVGAASGKAGILAYLERWSLWLEAVRRIGIAVYLVSISLGPATIVTVLRFQTLRIAELPRERRG